MLETSTRAEVAQRICHWQDDGLVVGFTSGVFDLLHVGHLDYLTRSKEHCDRLVVAVNSDASVRSNKGPSRPIVPQEQRAAMVAGLKPIDDVFIFDERNNNHNIEICRPDVYIKAGDYDLSRLSSAPIIEAYGGKVCIIPLESPTSSTGIIETAIAKTLPAHGAHAPRGPRACFFLDRDGVINREIGYLHDPEQFELLDGVKEALTILANLDVAVVLVTNQAGIGLGYFSHEDFFQVNRRMFRELSSTGIGFDRIFYCPHGVNDGCTCRKPQPGMIERAFEELNLIRSKSWIIGDMETDVQAGASAGIKTARLLKKDEVSSADLCSSSLLEAVEDIVAAEGFPARNEMV